MEMSSRFFQHNHNHYCLHNSKNAGLRRVSYSSALNSSKLNVENILLQVEMNVSGLTRNVFQWQTLRSYSVSLWRVGFKTRHIIHSFIHSFIQFIYTAPHQMCSQRHAHLISNQATVF